MNLVTVELTRRSVTLSSAEFFAHLLPPFVALSEFSNFNILPLLDSSLIPLALHVYPIRTVAVPSLLRLLIPLFHTTILPLLLSRLISPTESATAFPICLSLFFTPFTRYHTRDVFVWPPSPPYRSQTRAILRTDFTASCPCYCRLSQILRFVIWIVSFQVTSGSPKDRRATFLSGYNV